MPDLAPFRIGKYEVRSAIKEGGFGCVYRAWDYTVGRNVAIKVLKTHGTPDMIARFQNEATATGNLHHENIVIIYDSGTHEGQPYIAMEYLEGADLQDVISASQPLTLLDKVRIMEQVGRGLQCAHASGIVHRDVKPANVMVQPNGVVKIMDFGIARFARDDATRLTQTGFMVGTIRYMSPEQFEGLDADALSDIFAYGVIFYELVAGVHPFEAPNAAAFIHKIREGNPTPLCDLVPSCPRTLEMIVVRALERSRDLRYQSIDDLLLDMRPPLLDLQRARAAELVARARELFDSDQVPQAQAAVREAVDLDSTNPDVWELRERIQQSVHRRSIRPKIDTLLKTAESAFSQRMFPEAVESLEQAARLDPSATDIGERLRTARQLWEVSRQTARLLNDANRELQKQNFTLAGRLATEALGLDAQNPKAAELVETVRKATERRDNERRLKLALEDARRLAAVEDYDSAIEKLTHLQDVSDPSGQVASLLTRITEQRAERIRRDRLSSEKRALQGILRESRFADALPMLESLSAEFPEDRDLAALLSDTRQQVRMLQRAADIQKATAEASSLRSEHRFAEAEETLRRLGASYPDDSEISFLVAEAVRLREEAEGRQKVSEIVRRAESMIGEARFEDARHALDAALRDFSGNSLLLSVRGHLDAEWNAHRKAERMKQALVSAQARISEGRYDSALMVLKQAAVEDPRNPAIEDLLREAQRLAEQQRVNRAIDHACRQARGFAQAHDFAAAIAALERERENNPGDPRLKEALEAVSQEKQQWDQEQRVAAAIRSATQLLRGQRFREAIQALESELERLPEEPALLRLWDQAKTEWESFQRGEAVARAATEIRSALEQNRFDDAQRLLQQHAGQFGSEPSFLSLRKEVEEALRNTERRRQVAEAVERVRQLENQRDWQAALGACQVALVQFPGAPELTQRLGRIQQELDRGRREGEIARLSSVFKQAFDLKDWRGAALALEEMGQRYPDEPSLASLRASLDSERRRAEAEQALSRLEQAIEHKDWANAEKLISAAAAAAAGAPRIAELRARMDRIKSRDRACDDARAALKKGRFEDAERLLSPVVASDPADAEAASLLSGARAKRVAAEAEAAVREGRKRAKSLSKEQQFDAAIRLLQDLIGRYGSQPDLQRDLAEISAEAERQKAVLRLKERQGAGDARTVFAETTQLLKIDDSPEVRRLREWARSTLEALPAATVVPESPPAPPSQIGTPAPQIGTPPPQIGTPAPQIGTPPPQIGTPAPQIGTPPPRIGTPPPQIGTPAPRIGTPPPQIGTPPPQPFWRRPAWMAGLAVLLLAGGVVAYILLHKPVPVDTGGTAMQTPGTVTGPASKTGAAAATGTTAVETGGRSAVTGATVAAGGADGTTVPGRPAATGATSLTGARGPAAATGGARNAGPDPLVLAAHIGGLLDRGDWNGGARELNLVPGELRKQPEFLKLADRIDTHAENEKLLASARADLQGGRFQDAADKARRLSNTEFKEDARRVGEEAQKQKEDARRAGEEAQKQQVNQLAVRIQTEIAAGNAAQARQSLAAVRKAYPSEPRWDGMEAAIRDLEKPKAPECPPVPAAVPDNAPPVYSGSPERTFTWSGAALPKGCSIVLQAGSTSAGGRPNAPIPKFPAEIFEFAPAGISPIEAPKAENGYRIVLRNDSSGPVLEIRFHWKRR